jgi:hypothetical protein
MEINKSSIKYMEWRSAEDLHDDILNCVSEVRFIKDEQQFLEDLIKNHTIELIGGNSYENSKEVIGLLSQLRKELDPLLTKLMSHSNSLQILLDEEETPNEMEEYKEGHYTLMFEVVAYYAKFKKVKRKIFSLIKVILKQSKQKRLLK